MSRSRGEPLALGPREVERFYVALCFTDTCSIWMQSISRPAGYGQWWLRRPDGQQRVVSAHRAGYEIARGPLAAGATLMHDCEVRLCVSQEPGHVRAATQAENVDQAVYRRRMVGNRPGMVDTRGPVGQAEAIQQALRKAITTGITDSQLLASVLADAVTAGDPLLGQLRLL